jgi:Right handed beta helix region
MNKGNVSLALSIGLAVIATVQAGDLNPPPGPIAPTMKTLVEVEPRTTVQSLPGSGTAIHVISQPGSYYLAGNIIGESGKSGIVFATSDISIDLNGFAILGIPGSLIGIAPEGTPPGSFGSITIKNGVVRGWGGGGIVMIDDSNTGSGTALVSHIHADGNGGHGIKVGQKSRVVGCRATGNTLDGIWVDAGGSADDCVSGGNGGTGFTTAEGCTIRNCTAHENVSGGISTGSGCTIANSTVSTNGGSGISLAGGSVVQSCSARGNTGNGIEVGGGSTVINCESMEHEVGVAFLAGRGGLVANCTVQGSRSVGIAASDGTIVRNCSIVETAGPGITTANGVLIADCMLFSNSPGITANTECYVLGNNLKLCNPGIKVVGSGCRVDGNNLVGSGNTVGILVDVGGNIIFRNSVRNYGTHYSFSGTNTVGPIITATGTISTTNPWANFSY